MDAAHGNCQSKKKLRFDKCRSHAREKKLIHSKVTDIVRTMSLPAPNGGTQKIVTLILTVVITRCLPDPVVFPTHRKKKSKTSDDRSLQQTEANIEFFIFRRATVSVLGHYKSVCDKKKSN